jgi:ribosomal protein L23
VKFKPLRSVVDKKANKVQIKKAVEAAYGVTILSVNTMNVRRIELQNTLKVV